MRLKADRHCFCILLPGAAHNLLEHVAVRTVNAVEIADAYQRGAEVGGNFLEFVEDLHEAASSFWLIQDLNRKGR